MSTETLVPDHRSPLCASTRRDPASEERESHAVNDLHLSELEKLVRDVLAAPADEVDSEVVALVRGAMKVQKKFSISLALRALRLEQGLRQAQQQVIRLQWELAQLNRSFGRPPSAASEDED
jgi:hypothetical protein